jgi:glucose/arabinose dehydrogenase
MTLRSGAAGIVLGMLTAFTTAAPAGAAVLPDGFVESKIASLSDVTAMAAAPDGRLFVARQTGELHVIENGALLPGPFLTLATEMAGERGLLGVAFDPAFAQNGHVYVYNTAATPTIHNRVSRFTASGNTAVPGSEVVLLELDPLGGTIHNGGALRFGPDGTLYIATSSSRTCRTACR